MNHSFLQSTLLIFLLWYGCHAENVAFWHIYGNNNVNHSGIVSEQWRVIASSGLLSKIDKIFYSTVNAATTINHFSEKLQHLGHSSAGHETLTLKKMQQFCLNNVDSNVLYFHNKGSFHATYRNLVFRRALDCYNLSPHCLEALQTGKFDTCGMRISPIPHMHYSGNFFWATCKHVNKLIDPLSMEINETMINGTLKIARGRPTQCLGMGRHFAETWVTSLPNFSPADCMEVTRHVHYLYGEEIKPQMYQHHCPNAGADWQNGTRGMVGDAKLSFGESCGRASIAGAPLTLSFRITSETKKADDCSNINVNVKRSFLWYGQPPGLYLQWMKANLKTMSGTKNGRWDAYRKYDVYINSSKY